MPEGPEIKRAANQIAAAIAGKEAAELFFAFDHLKPFESLLAGIRITAVEARAKAILIRFDNGLNIYSHNQLYGKWIIRKLHDYPETRRQLRLAIHNDRKSALLYSASEIEVLTDDEIITHPFLSKLGPDLLDEDTTIEQVRRRFSDKRFVRRKLASLLLDQKFLAGLGNYLRSEIMFIAGVMPNMRPSDCTADQLDRLARASIELTSRSFDSGGITNSPERVAQLKAAGKKRRDYRFMVFARGGQSCLVCRSQIQKDEAGGRRFYFCPQCQGG